jgi:uncharacterized delta-60 repeat protein
VQPDAKILVAVHYDPTDEGPPIDRIGGVYRFTESGALDPSFATGGLLQIPALGGGPAMALQPDGNIIVCAGGKTDDRLTLVRITPQGTLDATFGAGGIVKGPADLDHCYDIAVDAGGRYVVTSYRTEGTPSTSTAVVLRFLSNGALDGSFGSGGQAATKLGGKSASLTRLRVAPTGIYFTGTRQMEGSTYVRGVIARMTDGGVLDGAFGAAGVHENPYSVFEVLPLAGGSSLFAIQNDVFRLTPQGTLDASYTLDKGPPGGPILSFGMSAVDAQQRQYRFKVSGGSWYGELWAYEPNGALDTSFADAGRIVVHPGMDADPTDMVIGPDGRLVVLAGTGAALWLARFVL